MRCLQLLQRGAMHRPGLRHYCGPALRGMRSGAAKEAAFVKNLGVLNGLYLLKMGGFSMAMLNSQMIYGLWNIYNSMDFMVTYPLVN